MQSASMEFVEGRASAACRKFEEAYSCWRYYKQEGESNWLEVEWKGASTWEDEQVRAHMIQSL